MGDSFGLHATAVEEVEESCSQPSGVGVRMAPMTNTTNDHRHFKAACAPFPARPTDTGDCYYCGKVVEADFDSEGRYWYVPGSHYACRCDAKPEEATAWVMTVHPGRQAHIRYFASDIKAHEVGAEYRRNNSREWACGRDLSIIVVTATGSKEY